MRRRPTSRIDSLQLECMFCDCLSAEPRQGWSELVHILRAGGARLLEHPAGPVHPCPIEAVDENGNVGLNPHFDSIGLEHALLACQSYDFLAGRVRGTAGLGYRQKSRTFHLSQATFKRSRKEINALANGLLAIALSLHSQMLPKYGWIDSPHDDIPVEEDVAATEIEILCWANIIGPSIVTKYGKEYLLGAPAWRTEELDSGAILLVACERYCEWWVKSPLHLLEYLHEKAPRIRTGVGRTTASG